MEVSLFREVNSIFNSYLDPSLKSWIFALIALGFLYKKIFKVNKNCLTIAIVATGVVVALLNGLGMGGMTAIALVGYAIGQGLLVSGSSIVLYDIGKGLAKIYKAYREKKQLEAEVKVEEVPVVEEQEGEQK